MKLDQTKSDLIRARLRELEATENVRVLYACESGSRAWGFASEDSDWDVRFIYVRPPSWYLSVDRKRDVLERPLEGDLDVSGWDLPKALHLLRRSNPPLLEWLDSPIVYACDNAFLSGFCALVPTYFSPRSCMYHYLNMARRNMREQVRTDTVRLKKYLYTLRPLLGCHWLQREPGPVPTRFETLVEKLVEDGPLRREIVELLELKKSTPELGYGPARAHISAFIEGTIEKFSAVAPTLAGSGCDQAPLDAFFRTTLSRLYPQEYTCPGVT